MRFVGQQVDLDILMLGRGKVRGRVTYDDGTEPAELKVVAFSPVFSKGGGLTSPPAAITRWATCRSAPSAWGPMTGCGNFGYQTVEIPTAGAETVRDFIIFRHTAETGTGDVHGIVVDGADDEPVVAAYVALYVDDALVGVERSDRDGKFDFGTVPARLRGDRGLRTAAPAWPAPRSISTSRPTRSKTCGWFCATNAARSKAT